MNLDELTQRRRSLAERLNALLTALFAGLGSWRDEDATRFTRQAVPLVRGSQQALAELVAVYLADAAAESTQRTIPPPVIPAGLIIDLRGVLPVEVYTRPFQEVWAALARGETLPDAVQRGVTRLGEVLDGDLHTTYAHANREGMRRLRTQPTGWRRVLQGSESCALCVLASTHRYSIEDLNPIHPHCDCAVAPVFGDDEQADDDDARLEQVHQAVRELTGSTADRGGRAVDYRQIRITQDHGELGPMLARPGDKFTGPQQIPST